MIERVQRMRYLFRVFFDMDRPTAEREVEQLTRGLSGLTVLDGVGVVTSSNENAARELHRRIVDVGINCSLSVAIEYERDDALAADLGIVGLGPSNTDAFKGILPRDAFDFSTACPCCGLGAQRAKPLLLSERAIRCKGNFYDATDAGWPVIRAEIGREIIK